MTALGRGFRVYAAPLDWLDFVLRRGVAETCGLWLQSRPARYALLLLHLGVAAALLWGAPRYWPDYAWLGYFGLAWAFLVLVAVVRQWTWVERQYDGPPARADLDWIIELPELRDEAVLALALLVLMIPVVLWRLDASFGLFEPTVGGPALWTDWAAFFGVELAKALPIADWAEIYGARSGAALSPAEPYGLYAVFAARAVIDLALLGAVIHIVARAGRMGRQWRAFLAGERELVEPSLERRAVRLLKAFAHKSGGSWFDAVAPTDLGPLKRYNTDRLLALTEHEDAQTAAIAAHAAFAQSPGLAFLPIAREAFEDDRRARALDLKTALLLTDLLGRANDAAARELLERVLTGFEGRSGEVTWRVRCRAAISLATTWRVAPESERTELLESEVVQRLRYGLQRNRDEDPQIRATIGDQLSVVGGAGALDAIVDHLEHEPSSVVLTNLAGDMQRMIAGAPREPLRRASGVARLRAAILQAKARKSDADRLAARALIQAADAMDRVVKEARREAVLGTGAGMVIVEPA